MDTRLTFPTVTNNRADRDGGDDFSVLLPTWDLATSPTGPDIIQMYFLSELQIPGGVADEVQNLNFHLICKTDSFDTPFSGTTLSYTVGDPAVDIDLGK